VVQCGAVWCSVLHCVGVCWCETLEYVIGAESLGESSVVQFSVVWRSVAQCGAVWRSVLQCAAARDIGVWHWRRESRRLCCNVVQCVAA